MHPRVKVQGSRMVLVQEKWQSTKVQNNTEKSGVKRSKIILTLDVCRTSQGGTHQQEACCSEARLAGVSGLLVMTTYSQESSRNSLPPPDYGCLVQTSLGGPPASASVQYN